MANSCTKIRRRLVTHSTMNMLTGELTPVRQEWKTEACNTPLFGKAERETGICRSCASGWTHPNNYPAESTDA